MSPAFARGTQLQKLCAPSRRGQFSSPVGFPTQTAASSPLGWETTALSPPPFRPRKKLQHAIRLLQIAAIAYLLPALVSAQPLPAPSARFVVVIDAAHGGDEAGGSIASATGQPQPEKSLTLALSVRLRSLLAARGISVVTTREADTALNAQQRAELANHAEAQACITLHASTSGNGVHLFLSSLPHAQPAHFMPWKTAQAAYVDRSVALAGMLNSALTHAGVKVTLGRTALTSIDSMTCPAIAVEVAPEPKPGGGTISLDDPDYQAKIATALSAGILEWRTEPRQP